MLLMWFGVWRFLVLSTFMSNPNFYEVLRCTSQTFSDIFCIAPTTYFNFDFHSNALRSCGRWGVLWVSSLWWILSNLKKYRFEKPLLHFKVVHMLSISTKNATVMHHYSTDWPKSGSLATDRITEYSSCRASESGILCICKDSAVSDQAFIPVLWNWPLRWIRNKSHSLLVNHILNYSLISFGYNWWGGWLQGSFSLDLGINSIADLFIMHNFLPSCSHLF